MSFCNLLIIKCVEPNAGIEPAINRFRLKYFPDPPCNKENRVFDEPDKFVAWLGGDIIFGIFAHLFSNYYFLAFY